MAAVDTDSNHFAFLALQRPKKPVESQPECVGFFPSRVSGEHS
jgi:hypothetical protein